MFESECKGTTISAYRPFYSVQLSFLFRPICLQSILLSIPCDIFQAVTWHLRDVRQVPCLTKWKREHVFAYTPVFGKLPNFGEKGSGQGLGRFSGEMRSNRKHIEWQEVTKARNGRGARNCQLCMAKSSVFARFCTLFGLDFRQTRRALLPNK